MNILAIVILTGAGCASPLDHAERTTVAYQVPCAVMIYAPTANPFKITQQQNAISAPSHSVKPRKATRCGGRRVVWFKKHGKRRYRCA